MARCPAMLVAGTMGARARVGRDELRATPRDVARPPGDDYRWDSAETREGRTCGRSANRARQLASSWSRSDHEDGGPTIPLPAADARCTLRSLSGVQYMRLEPGRSTQWRSLGRVGLEQDGDKLIGGAEILTAEVDVPVSEPRSYRARRRPLRKPVPKLSDVINAQRLQQPEAPLRACAGRQRLQRFEAGRTHDRAVEPALAMDGRTRLAACGGRPPSWKSAGCRESATRQASPWQPAVHTLPIPHDTGLDPRVRVRSRRHRALIADDELGVADAVVALVLRDQRVALKLHAVGARLIGAERIEPEPFSLPRIRMEAAPLS